MVKKVQTNSSASSGASHDCSIKDSEVCDGMVHTFSLLFCTHKTIETTIKKKRYGRTAARHARDRRRAKISTEQYIRERNERKKKQIDRNWKRRTLLMYQKERAEELMARLTGKAAYGELDGHKITAFQRSVYYDDRVGNEMVQFGRNKQAVKQEECRQVSTSLDRDKYLLQKYNTNESFKHYYKSELSSKRASSVRYKLDIDHTRSTLIRNSLSNGVLSRGAAKILENYYLKKKRKNGLE